MVGLNSLAASWELAALIYEAKRRRLNTQGLGGFCLSHLTPAASRRGGDLGKRVRLLWKGRLPASALGRALKAPLGRQFVKIGQKSLECVYCSSTVGGLAHPRAWMQLSGRLGICQVLPVLLRKELTKKKPHHAFVTKINSGVSTALL